MANQVVNREVNIYIKSGEAQKALDALLKKETALKEQLKQATDPKEVDRLTQAMKKLEEPIERARKKLAGELEPSLRDVQAAAKKVRDEFSRMSKSDEGYEHMLHNFHQANKELDAQKEKMGMLHHAMKGFWAEAKMMATGMLMANGIMGLFSMIGDGVNRIISGSAKVSDELSDIEKTSGLTHKQVEQLNTALAKINTRSSLSDLREIALGLGQVGEAVNPSNVEALDKIIVALGDEFGGGGQEITNTLTVLRNNLQDIKTGDYGADVLHIGNALNVLGAEGLATAPVVSDIANRIAGVGGTFKLTAGEILGTAATFQELGIPAERGSTAFIKILQKIAAEPEKFAKVAGKSIGDFTNLVNTDMMGAFIAVATGAKKAGDSNVAFGKILKDLDTDGSGAGEVLSKIAKNADLLVTKTDRATEVLKEQGSVLDEFSKKNDNAAGEMAKLQKNIDSIFESTTLRSAGEAIIRTLNSFVNVLKGIPEFVKENRYWLLTLAVGIAVLNKAYIASAIAIARKTIAQKIDTLTDKAAVIWGNLKTASTTAYGFAVSVATGQITLAAAAQRIWNAALSIGLGPLGIALTVIGALGVALSVVLDRTRQISAEERVSTEVKKRVSDATTDQITKINLLMGVLKDENVSLENRQKAYKELIKIHPPFAETLRLSKEGHLEGAGAVDVYVESLKRRAEMEAKLSLFTEKKRERDAQQLEVDRLSQNLPSTLIGQIGGAMADIVGLGPYAQFDKANNKLKQLDEEIVVLNKDLSTAAQKNMDDFTGAVDGAAASAGNLTGEVKKVGKEAKQAAEDMKRLAEELQKIAFSLLPEGFDKDLKELNAQYDKLRAMAHGNKTLLLQTEELYQIQLANLRDKYFTRSVQIDETRDEKEKERVQKLVERAQAALKLLNQNIEQGFIKGPRDRQAELELAAIRSSGKARLQADLELLHFKRDQELKNTNLTENEILLIKEKYRQQEKEMELQHLVGLTQQIIQWAGQALSIFDVFANARTERENADLERDRKINEKKKQNLEKRLKAGHISQLQYDRETQKLEKDQEKREKEVRLRQFRRDQRMQVVQALMNGAQAVVSTLAARPGSLDIISLGAFRAINIGLAVAATAAQVAAIASKKPPEFGRGGRLSGPSHQDRSRGLPVTDPYTGRIQAYLEGKEAIVNKHTMADPHTYTVSGTPSQIISLLNAKGGGVHWQTGAVLRPGWSTQGVQRMNFEAINSSINRVHRFYAAGGVFDSSGQPAAANQSPGLSAELLQLMKDMVATNAATQQTLASIQRFGIEANVRLGNLRDAEAREAAILSDATAKA